jgi:hypothetical protein
MNAWLLAALMASTSPGPQQVAGAATAPAAPRLEAALFLPLPGQPLAPDPFTVYNAMGLVLAPQVRTEALYNYFNGANGRFVTSAALVLSGPGALTLPLASGDLDGAAPASPSSLRVDVRGYKPIADGGQLSLVVTLTSPPQQAAGQLDAVVTQRAIPVKLTLSYQGSYVVLLDSVDPATRQGPGRRQQVGTALIEIGGPLVGLALRLVKPGELLAFDHLTAPLAPPGQVRVAAEAGRETSLLFQPGLTLTEAIAASGLQPTAIGQIRITRKLPDGSLDRTELDSLPPAGSAQDCRLADRDSIAVGGQLRRVLPPSLTARAPGAGLGSKTLLPGVGPLTMDAGAGFGGGGGEFHTSQAPAADASPQPAFGNGLAAGDLKSYAAAAAKAAACVVWLRGKLPDGERRLCGTLVGPNSVVVTAPRELLAQVTDLRATLPDGRECEVERVGGEVGPLALLRLTRNGQPVTGLPYLTPVHSLPPLATPLLVIGSPYGLPQTLSLTFVAGAGQAVPGAPGAELRLVGSLALGNSGGPIIDSEGRLVGIAFGNLESGEPGPPLSLAVAGDVVERILNGR